MAEDRSIVIKPGDKGLCVVAWDKLDYLAGSENHLKDKNTYQDVKFGDDDLVNLVGKSNRMVNNFSPSRIYPLQDIVQSLSTLAITIRNQPI